MSDLQPGDIYSNGFRDGIRELLDVLRIALEDARIGERLPAIERVLAEYEDRFPATGEESE